VASIERGETQTATKLLRKSWRLNPYAIEQPLLLINILGREKFEAHEEEIRGIVKTATDDFDSDEYESGYSLVSLNYRLATMYYQNKNYPLAERYYKDAYGKLSLLQKYWGDNSMKNMIRLGIANALHGQNKKAEAQNLIGEILADAETDYEKSFIKSQYAGNIKT